MGWERGAAEADHERAELGSVLEYWHYHVLLNFSEAIRPSARFKIYNALCAWNGSKCHRVVGADNKVADMLGYIVKNTSVQDGATTYEYGEHKFDLTAFRALYYAGLRDKTHGESSDVLGKKLDVAQRKRLCRSMINDVLIDKGIRISSIRPGAYVDDHYRPMTRLRVVKKMRDASIHRIFDVEMIQKTFQWLEAPDNVVYRSEFQLYNPSRQYIEFNDCMVDLHGKECFDKPERLTCVDPDGDLTEIHPVAYIESDFESCVHLPITYVRHVARLMTGSQFMSFFGRYFDPIVPKACALLLTGPPNVGKSTVIAPFVELFQNVTCFINGDDTRFTWTSAYGYQHVFCEDINPLDSHVFDSDTAFRAITGGEPFTCPVKHGNPVRLPPLLQLYSTNDNLAHPDSLPLWIPGARERLCMYAIPMNTPSYDGLTVVRPQIMEELGQIVYYMVFRPEELVYAIDKIRAEILAADKEDEEDASRDTV
jgi:hypothetical protein